MVCEKIVQKIPPLKKRRPIKKSQKEEDEIKRKLIETYQYYIDCKFQIHWNKLEWVNPRSHDERKIHFVCLLKKIVLKITFKLQIGLITRN